MDTLLTRLRGLMGVGLTWGGLWALIGGVIGVILGVATPNEWSFATTVFDWTLGMGLYGLVSGFGFGALLSLGEGRKRLLELSLPKVAFWGVLGAAAVPLLFGALGTFPPGTTWIDVIGAMLVTAGLGGTSAPASVAIAKRAELAAPSEARLLDEG